MLGKDVWPLIGSQWLVAKLGLDIQPDTNTLSRVVGEQTSYRKSKSCSRSNVIHSYNRYLAVAARVVRRSLKEDKRIAAERRGEMELRFAKWEVRDHGNSLEIGNQHHDVLREGRRTSYKVLENARTVIAIALEHGTNILQNGKQGDNKNLATVNAQAAAEHASSAQQ